MEHQFGYCIGLSGIIFPLGVGREHVAPVIFLTLADGFYIELIGCGGISGNGSLQLIRILIIHHYLCHGCSYASCSTQLRTFIFRTHLIIRCQLVPGNISQERRYFWLLITGISLQRSLLSQNLSDFGITLGEGCNKLLISFQKRCTSFCLHQILRVAMSRIAYNLRQFIITRNDGESLVGSVVKNIIAGSGFCRTATVLLILLSSLAYLLLVHYDALQGSLALGNSLCLLKTARPCPG